MCETGPAMKLIVTATESDRHRGTSVYKALIQLYRRRGLAVATVSRAIVGFRGSGPLQTVDLLDLASSLPVRIEVIDTPEAIEAILPEVFDIVDRGVVEVQKTHVLKFVP